MFERDPLQRGIDDAALDRAEGLSREHREEVAVLFNHAVVKAFSGKG